jgi:PadR family transcriptional regulator, regulatory protein AphA
MAREQQLSTTEGAVLGLLAFGERSGYDLALLAEDSVAHLWTPSRSQIYKTLPHLVAAGLARRRDVEQLGRPDKAVYRITRAGKQELRRWLDDVEDEPASGRVVFPLKFFFAGFASEGTADAQLAAYRRYLERRLGRYESLREAPDSFDAHYARHVLEHGITRVRATLAWIDETAAAIESSTAAPASSRPLRSSRGLPRRQR